MQAFKFAEYPSNSAVAAGVTALVSAWFLVAGATVLASPTVNEVARHATVKVSPGAALVPIQEAAAPAATPVATAPDAHFRIVVEARRA